MAMDGTRVTNNHFLFIRASTSIGFNLNGFVEKALCVDSTFFISDKSVFLERIEIFPVFCGFFLHYLNNV
jgi:hypothetical protein